MSWWIEIYFPGAFKTVSQDKTSSQWQVSWILNPWPTNGFLSPRPQVSFLCSLRGRRGWRRREERKKQNRKMRKARRKGKEDSRLVRCSLTGGKCSNVIKTHRIKTQKPRRSRQMWTLVFLKWCIWNLQCCSQRVLQSRNQEACCGSFLGTCRASPCGVPKSPRSLV